MLIEPLIIRVKGRYGHIDDSHFTDGSMTATWLDQDRRAGADLMELAIQFHLAVAFEDVIDLSQFAMVMRSCIRADINDVQRCGSIGIVGKGTTGLPTRAVDRIDLIGVDQVEEFFGWKDSHVIVIIKALEFKRSFGGL